MLSIPQIKDYKIDKKSRLFRMKGNIIGSKLIHQNGFHKNYIEYYVQIETDYLKWNLKKRYEEFYKLNKKLVEIIPELKDLFPPKRLFKSSDSTVSERIKRINKYMSYIFCNINIFLIDDLLNFISIDKDIIQLFIKKYSMLKIDEDNEVLISLNNAYEKIKQKEENKSLKERTKRDFNINTINIIENNIDNYYDSILDYEKRREAGFDWDEPNSITPYTIVIKEFLNNLSEKFDNNTEILHSFEMFLNKGVKWTRLKNKEILLLFIGEEGLNNVSEATNTFLSQTNYNNVNKKKKITSDFKYHSFIEFYGQNEDITFKEDEEDYYTLNYNNKINGLFYQIGKYKQNAILSIGALDLLDKLLDTGYNPDAEIYINVFKSCDFKYYKLLNLNKIIKMNIGGNKNNLKALKLLELIFEDNNREEYERILMDDDDVYRQYINYLNKFIE